jgi:hypothetical protein
VRQERGSRRGEPREPQFASLSSSFFVRESRGGTCSFRAKKNRQTTTTTSIPHTAADREWSHIRVRGRVIVSLRRALTNTHVSGSPQHTSTMNQTVLRPVCGITESEPPCNGALALNLYGTHLFVASKSSISVRVRGVGSLSWGLLVAVLRCVFHHFLFALIWSHLCVALSLSLELSLLNSLS